MRFTQNVVFFHKNIREGFEYIDITDLFTLKPPPPKKKTQKWITTVMMNGKLIVPFLLFRDLIFLYYSLRDTLLKYIKTPCYDISSITTHNATDVTDLIKQLPATIGNTKATDVWLCMYTTFTEEKPHKKSTKKKS